MNKSEEREAKKKEIRKLLKTAVSESDSGSSDTALSIIEQAIELGPQIAHLWSVKGQFLEELERFDEAEDAARKAIDLKTETPIAWGVLAHICMDREQFEKAAFCYKQLVEMKPDYGFYTILAAAEMQFDLESAIEHAKKALELNPEWEEAQEILRAAEKDLEDEGKGS